MKKTDKSNSGLVKNTSSILLFLSLIFLGTVLFIYLDKVVGILIVLVPIVYNFQKRYFSVEILDKFIFKLFSSRKKVVFTSVLILMAGSTIILINQIDLKDGKNRVNSFVGGIVWDENKEPLANVFVFSPELEKSDTTDNTGRFKFIIDNGGYSSITILAQKEGYETYESEISAGNTSFNFILMKK